MTYQNLSTIGATYVLEVEGENGPEYWKGGMDFTTDINDASKYGTGNAVRFIKYLEGRAIRAKPIEVPSHYQIMQWPDLGWVVLNTQHVEATVHRVRRVMGDDDWFFTEDPKTTLVVKHPGETEDHYQVNFDGATILDVTHVIDGQVMEEFTTFSINDNSNLKYMFEFESKPVEELEVA